MDDLATLRVTGYMHAELEKIAAAKHVVLGRYADDLQRGLSDLRGHLGVARHIPFTRAHRAYDAARLKANAVSRRARAARFDLRAQALDDVAQRGHMSQNASRALDATKGVPKTRAGVAAANAKERVVGAKPPPPVKDKKGGGAFGNKALLGGAAVLGAGGVYLGTRKKNNEYGY